MPVNTRQSCHRNRTRRIYLQRSNDSKCGNKMHSFISGSARGQVPTRPVADSRRCEPCESACGRAGRCGLAAQTVDVRVEYEAHLSRRLAPERREH
jgi:hypothetical protein